MVMVGILDGINDSLKQPNPIETMDETTELSLDYDKEKLYYNMVEAKATWLYELPQWDAILTPEKRKELYKNQKASGTVRKGKKIFQMIRVHAEAERSTKSAAVRTLKQSVMCACPESSGQVF